MLGLMRKHAKNWLMKLLLGIIIIVFIFYFGSLREKDRADAIATLDGKAISYVDFQNEYEKLIETYRKRLGQNLNDELLKRLKLKEQATDNLIKQAIILEKAEELNLKADDEEIRNAILSYPAFQNNGVFDRRMYEETLRLNKMTADNFEAMQKKLLITTKLQDIIISGVHVSDRELLDFYRIQNEKISVRFLKFSSKAYKGRVIPSRQALENYLKGHGNELRVPEQIQVKYISFLASDFAKSVKITDVDIKEYYDRNKERLSKPGAKPPQLEKVRDQISSVLRQISGMQSAASEAKKAHDTIYQQENFDAFASGKGIKIHLSPLFSTNGVPAEFRAVGDFSKNISSLQKNEISPVLSDDRGYYVFQLASKRPSHIPDLKEAGKEIEARYVEDEAAALCKTDAEAILKRLKNGEVLEKIAKEKGLKIDETGPFLLTSNPPSLGDSPKLTEMLAELSKGKPYPDQLLQLRDGFAVICFKERGKLDTADFQNHKIELKRIFLELKRSEVINSWIEGLKSSLIKEGRLKITKDLNES